MLPAGPLKLEPFTSGGGAWRECAAHIRHVRVRVQARHRVASADDGCMGCCTCTMCVRLRVACMHCRCICTCMNDVSTGIPMEICARWRNPRRYRRGPDGNSVKLDEFQARLGGTQGKRLSMRDPSATATSAGARTVRRRQTLGILLEIPACAHDASTYWHDACGRR